MHALGPEWHEKDACLREPTGREGRSELRELYLHAREQACDKPRSASHACPQILAFVLADGRLRLSLEADYSLKGSPQSRIVDPCDVAFENRCSLRIIARGDCLADFTACPAKETRRRWPPLLAECVDLVGHGKYGRLVLWIAGDGKTQEQQELFANSAGPPILRTELSHLTSCHFGDCLHFGALRRNGGAVFTHRARLDHQAVLFQHGTELSIGRRLLGVNPDDQRACGA
jgi:hypothetical protein